MDILRHFIKPSSRLNKDFWSRSAEDTEIYIGSGPIPKESPKSYPRLSIPPEPTEKFITSTSTVGPPELSFVYPSEQFYKTAPSWVVERTPTSPEIVDIKTVIPTGFLESTPSPIILPPVWPGVYKPDMERQRGYIPPPPGPDISKLPRCPEPGCAEPTKSAPYKGKVMITGAQVQPMRVVEMIPPPPVSMAAPKVPRGRPVGLYGRVTPIADIKPIKELMPTFKEKIVCSDCAPRYGTPIKQMTMPRKYKYLPKEKFSEVYPYSPMLNVTPITSKEYYRGASPLSNVERAPPTAAEKYKLRQQLKKKYLQFRDEALERY